MSEEPRGERTRIAKVNNNILFIYIFDNFRKERQMLSRKPKMAANETDGLFMSNSRTVLLG